MNLSALMNDGDEEQDKKRRSPEVQRNSQPSVTPITNGHPAAPGYGSHPQLQAQTPLYAPPPLGTPRGSGPGSQGLTLLYTPGQGPQGAQYPFPSSAGISSAGAVPPYRTSDPHSAVTPGGRPPSHGYPYPHHSPQQQHMQHPGQHQPAGYPQYQQGHVSASPPPSSHHSQHTPHSVRQSPVSVMSHPPHSAHPGGSYPQQYQQYQQPTTPLGPPPLLHQRSSGPMPELTSPYHQRTFSGASNGMPSKSPSINNLVESPNAYHRPSPSHQRTTSEYLGQIHRERERSLSVSPKTKVAPRPPSLGSRENSMQESNTMSRGSAQHSIGSASSLSNVPPSHVTHPPSSHVAQAPPQPQPDLASVVPQSAPSLQQTAASPQDQTNVTAAQPPAPQNMAQPAANPRKRPASDSVGEEPPSKRKPKRKYTSRPSWAILSRHNPRYHEQGPMPEQHKQPNGHPPSQFSQPQLQNGAKTEQWQHDPPLDFDLIHASKILGKWEKTFRWSPLMPDTTKRLSDWLYSKMEELQDVGTNPREGTVEIEARIGHLIDTNTNSRLDLGCLTSTIMNPNHNSRYRFDSDLPPDAHQAMNNYLNAEIKNSLSPGRVRMIYKHLYETDSFYTLSPIGLTLLPESLKRRRGKGREPRLRMTRDSKTGEVLGRIVKLNIENLHIHNPSSHYDVRVSVNLEVNLNRPDIDPSALIAPSEMKTAPDRVKDRLSYKHLAYQIDLTKVDTPESGEPSTYELECEVDSNLLRAQLQLLKEQGPAGSAFIDLVEGFWGDFMILAKETPPAGAMAAQQGHGGGKAGP